MGIPPEIASRLEAWVDTGHKVIEKVFLGRQIYGAGPLTASGPDMIMGYGLGYRASWQTAIGGVPTRLVEDNKSAWSGDHIFDPRLVPGILLANARIPAHEPRGIDVAPTILAALGVPRPSHMQGEPMLGA